MIIYDGINKAVFNEKIRTGKSDVFSVTWQDRIGSASMVTSTWDIPAGWTKSNELTNVSVVEDGETFTNTNRALITVPIGEAPGRYQITNNQTFDDDRDLPAIFFVVVA